MHNGTAVISPASRWSKERLLLPVLLTAVLALLATIGLASPALAASRASVTIKVTTSSGVPAPGLFVALGDKVKKTHADGTVRFTKVKTGKRAVVVSQTKGFVTTGWQYDTSVRVSSSSSSVTVRPSGLAVVRGTVKLDGKKKKGADVTVTDTTGNEVIGSATTDKDGRYAVSVAKTRLSSRALRVTATFSRGRVAYAPGTQRLSEALEFHAPWGHSKTMNVTTSDFAKGRIKGKVRLADGSLAAGATVRVLSTVPGVADTEPVRRVLTGANGKFVVGGLAKGTYRVDAVDTEEPEVASSAAVTVSVKAKKVSVGTLAFRRTGVLKVTVESPSSSAYDSVTAVLLDQAGNQVVQDWLYFGSGASASPSVSSTFTYVPVGTYRVAIAGHNVATPFVTVTAGATTVAPSLTLGQKTKLSGKVVLPDGSGAHARVMFTDTFGTQSGYWRYSDRDSGAFSTNDLVTGRYRVNAEVSDKVTVGTKKVHLVQAVPLHVDVTPGTPVTGFKVPLVVAGTVSGTVRRSDSGRSITGITVTATRVTPIGEAALDVTSTGVDSKGRYTLDTLVPGVAYLITFTDGDGVYRTTYLGGKTKASKAKTVTVGSAKTKKLGTTAVKR